MWRAREHVHTPALCVCVAIRTRQSENVADKVRSVSVRRQKEKMPL